MIKKRRIYLLMAYLLLITIIIGLFFIKNPSMLGFVTYRETVYEKEWGFSNPADYNYNASLISIAEGKAQLIPSVVYSEDITDYSVSRALYDPTDKTDQIIALDNKHFEANQNKPFDIFFGSSLENGDTVSFYLEGNAQGTIHLCGKGIQCSYPGHGSVSYNGNEGSHNITLSGLSSSAKEFNIVSSDALRINYITSTKGDAVKGLFDSQDKTDKISSIEGQTLNALKTKLLNVIFDNQLTNGDVVSLYLEAGTASEIYLCDYGMECSSPGYGSVSYDGQEGWYNITVSNLDSQTNVFNIDPDNVEIDYIKAARYGQANALTVYPVSAEIETDDFEADKLLDFILFSAEHLLNGQSISYYYSTDSGASWSAVPEDGNLSDADTSGKKMRIKAVLNSDTANTPVLDGFTIKYSALVCTENWIASYSECTANDLMLKTYADENSCGTEEGLPSDNGTYEQCDYCIPSVEEINTGCMPGDRMITRYNDLNRCYEMTGMEADKVPVNKTYACDYVVSTNFNGNTTDFSVGDLSNMSDVVLENTDYGRILFTEPLSVNESIDINSNVIISNNSIFLNSTALPMFNKSAVLRLYNLNFTNPIIMKDGAECLSGVCQKINYGGDVLEFNVTHFTTYSSSEGPYCGDGLCNNGESCSLCSSDCGVCPSQSSGGGSSGGGGGGGGGSSRRTTTTASTPEKTSTEQAEAPENAAIKETSANEEAEENAQEESTANTEESMLKTETAETTGLNVIVGRVINEIQTNKNTQFGLVVSGLILFLLLFFVWKKRKADKTKKKEQMKFDKTEKKKQIKLEQTKKIKQKTKKK